jgi:hypothetical protein
VVWSPTIYSLPELFNDYGTLDILEYFNPHEDVPDDKRVSGFTESDSVTLPPWTDQPTFDPGHKAARFDDPFVIRRKANSQYTAFQDSDFDESVYTPARTPKVKPVFSSTHWTNYFEIRWGVVFRKTYSSILEKDHGGKIGLIC